MGNDAWGEQSYGEIGDRSAGDATDRLLLHDTVTVDVELNGPYDGLHEMNPLLMHDEVIRHIELTRRN